MITDDELLLYYYRDGLEPGERARIGAALTEQPELAQRLHRLVSRLDAAAAIPEVPVPAETSQIVDMSKLTVEELLEEVNRRVQESPDTVRHRAEPDNP